MNSEDRLRNKMKNYKTIPEKIPDGAILSVMIFCLLMFPVIVLIGGGLGHIIKWLFNIN